MEVQLLKLWQEHLAERSGEALPSSVFSSKELVLSDDGETLAEGFRVIGTNDIGMVAWACTMKTPEYV